MKKTSKLILLASLICIINAAQAKTRGKNAFTISSDYYCSVILNGRQICRLEPNIPKLIKSVATLDIFIAIDSINNVQIKRWINPAKSSVRNIMFDFRSTMSALNEERKLDSLQIEFTRATLMSKQDYILDQEELIDKSKVLYRTVSNGSENIKQDEGISVSNLAIAIAPGNNARDIQKWNGSAWVTSSVSTGADVQKSEASSPTTCGGGTNWISCAPSITVTVPEDGYYIIIANGTVTGNLPGNCVMRVYNQNTATDLGDRWMGNPNGSIEGELVTFAQLKQNQVLDLQFQGGGGSYKCGVWTDNISLMKIK